MKIRLQVLNTELKGLQFETDKDSFRVGRSSDNDFALRQKSVSRVHALISVRDGRAIIEDIGSRNRTEVNGAKIGGPTPVETGDVISIGDVAMQVVLPDRAESVEEDAEVTPEAGVVVPAADEEQAPKEEAAQEAPSALPVPRESTAAPSAQAGALPAVAAEAAVPAPVEHAVPVPPALWPGLTLILGVTVTVLLVSYFFRKGGGADAPDAIWGAAIRVEEDKVIQVRKGYVNRPYVEHSDIVRVSRPLSIDMAIQLTGLKAGVTTVKLYNETGRNVEIHVHVLPREAAEVKKVFVNAPRTDKERLTLAIECIKRGEVMEEQNDPYEAMLQYQRALDVLVPFATHPNREYNEATDRLKTVRAFIAERYDLLMYQAGDFVRDGDKPMALERLSEIQRLIPDTKDVRRQNADLLMDILNRMVEAEKRRTRSGL